MKMFALSRFMFSARTLARALNRKHGRAGCFGALRPQLGMVELEDRVVPTLLGQQLFPSDNPWNQNISNAPVASNSAAIISHIGSSIHLHPDWGADSSANGSNPLYGIPVNIVHGKTTTAVNVVIDNYPGESDVQAVPIPANAVIEGDNQNGPNTNGGGYNANQRGDSHLIVWDEDNNIAYELFGASRPTDSTLFPDTSGNELAHTDGKWHAAQETVWDMTKDTFRTLGATSADAAGLSILAGLVRPDEGLTTAQGGQGAIDHALRMTLPSGDINPQYVYPASHVVSTSQGSANVPFGTRLRLANTTAINNLINNMPPESQIVARAMQQYGLIVADIGSAMYVTGSSASVDANNKISLTWDMNDIFASNGLETLTAGDFQVVNLTPVVTGLSASSAAPGTTITVNGQNFSGAAGHISVLFGTTAGTSVKVVSDTQLSVVVPNGSGMVAVTVQSGVNETDNISSNPNANVNAPIFGYGTSAPNPSDKFTFSSGAALTSISVTPANSSITTGSSQTFTATGTYSDNSTQVLSSGVTWASTNTAVATIDSTGKVTALTKGSTTITATDGSISGSTTLTVTLPVPAVTRVSPASGPATGGTTVTITGTNFTGATGVSFGSTAAQSFTVVSATQITATAPVGTNGQAVDITVTTAGGTSPTGTADQFTYTPGVYPPPTGLKAMAGNGTVTFSFNPISSALKYPYAQLIGNTLYPVYAGTSNPFTISAGANGALVNGQTYTFEVAVTYSPGHTSTWSAPVTVTVGTPPSITTQPSNQTVTLGSTATFTAAASGAPAPTVQWQYSSNGSTYTNLPGATSATYSVAAAAVASGYKFRAVFTNALGQVATSAATLTVDIGSGQQHTILSGQTVTGLVVLSGGALSVAAGGTANNLTVNSSGTVTVLGTLNGATINSGGTVTVDDGGSVTGSITDNGTLAYSLTGSDAFSGQLTGSGTLSEQGTGKLFVTSALNSNVAITIGNSSTLVLVGAANSHITFGLQSKLKLDDSQGFTGTLAATAGDQDVLDLGDLPFVSGVTTVQFVENTALTQGTLTVSDQANGGPTVQLTLVGDFTGTFDLAADSPVATNAGTRVTGPF
jgi:hypothetical protein